jgi:Flp pilus assembly protein TadG
MMERSLIRKEITRISRNLWHDTDGMILPYVTLMLPVIIGLGLLAVDGARYQSLQTQMQAAADAAALAGAAELNGKTGAILRATTAIDNYLSNYLSGMGIATAAQHSAPSFYSSLPAANQDPSNGTAALGDADAHFVLVTIRPVTVATMFPVSFLLPRGTNSFSIGAQAVAGMDENICDIPPVYICNPWEYTQPSLVSALSNLAERRKQIKLLNNGQNSPGHFGWLIPPDNNLSASNLQDWISRTPPKTCYSTSNVSLNTGAKQSALNGFNVRLNVGADSTHLPDINVLQPMPQDTSFPTSFQGNGQWNCYDYPGGGGYWNTKHPGVARPTVNEFGEARTCGNGTTIPTTFTRYEIYRYELTHNSSNSLFTPIPNGVAGRRVLQVAVINCGYYTNQMGGGNNAHNIPVEGFAKFFMTEQVPTTGSASSRNLMGEFTGEVTNLDAIIRQNVRLYR